MLKHYILYAVIPLARLANGDLLSCGPDDALIDIDAGRSFNLSFETQTPCDKLVVQSNGWHEGQNATLNAVNPCPGGYLGLDSAGTASRKAIAE